jgi:hypothetical protein
LVFYAPLAILETRALAWHGGGLFCVGIEKIEASAEQLSPPSSQAVLAEIAAAPDLASSHASSAVPPLRHARSLQGLVAPLRGPFMVLFELAVEHRFRTDACHRKIPWRLSRTQKARQRKRLRAVDAVVATVDGALARAGLSLKALERWKEEMPREEEMRPKDKYTMFDRKEKGYRKGIHSRSCPGIWKKGSRQELICIRLRTTKVDASQPATEPSWVLMSCS